MSNFEKPSFQDNPQISFIEEAFETHKLSAEDIKSYYSEALDLASSLCGGQIEQFVVGMSLKYNRALSESVVYMLQSGEEIDIGISLTVGPTSILDDTLAETIDLGAFGKINDETNSRQFMPFATLKEAQIHTGGIMQPRINHPADLDSFMIGIRYIAGQLQ